MNLVVTPFSEKSAAPTNASATPTARGEPAADEGNP
jgi:hypothetical protein